MFALSIVTIHFSFTSDKSVKKKLIIMLQNKKTTAKRHNVIEHRFIMSFLNKIGFLKEKSKGQLVLNTTQHCF